MAAGVKWSTEAERLAAIRESNRRYREAHAAQIAASYAARKPKILAGHRSYYERNRGQNR